MVNLDSRIIKKEKSKYTEDEVQYALNYLNSFLEKLQKLYVIEDGKKRFLNQLEKFICIYDFVTQRNYKKDSTSHDIIGAINNDCFVCLSFSKMIKILCDEVDIPCMIKYSDVTIGHHANNLVILKDNSDSMHLLHVDATIDCLNHSIQNVRKFNDYDLITRINGLLIAEEDINKYHKCQQYIDCLEQAAYFRLINHVEPQKLFEVTEEDEYIYDSFCEMMLDKVEHLTPNLVEMCKFLNITYEISIESEIIETYRLLQDVYEKIIIPISSDEILKAMYSVYTSLLIYNNDENNIDDKVNIMLLKKIQLSLEFQLKNYNNENGKSFMFELVNSINKR